MQKRKLSDWVFLAFLLAFTLRVILASIYAGHNDITYFRYWAVELQKDFFSFYDDLSYTSYLPGYHYVLYPVGLLAKILGIPYNSGLFIVMLKLPSIICDLVCAYLIYRISQKYASKKHAFIFCLLYLFNPAVFVNSSLWGQVDSFTALFTILCVYYTLDKKYVRSLAVVGAALTFKMQFVFILPVVGALMLKNTIGAVKEKRYKELANLGLGALAMVGAFLLFTLPITMKYVLSGKPFFFTEIYLAQLGAYDYMTLNCFNFYSMISKNWAPIPEGLIFGFLSYSALNYIIIGILSALCMLLMWRAKDKSSIYLICALLVLAVFTFSMEMHERYMFAAIPLLILAAASSKNKYIFTASVVFSLLNFLNCAILLTNGKQYFYPDDIVLIICSNIWVFFFIFFAIAGTYVAVKGGDDEEKAEEAPLPESDIEEELKKIEKKNARYDDLYQKKLSSRQASGLKRKDVVIMAAFFVAYFALNMIYLGGTAVPQTFWETESGQYIVLEIPQDVSVGEIWGYKGIDKVENTRHSIKVYAANSVDGSDYSSIIKQSNYKGERRVSNNGGNGSASLYKWFTVLSLEGRYRYVAFTCSEDVRINEIVLLEQDTRRIIDYQIAYASSDEIKNAFDERSLFPVRNSLMTDMYFDEIYHARTAFEHIMGWEPYEITHPPLGKIIISVGIRIFGMNPFGWRISGVLFSCLLLPVIYALGRLLFKSRLWASLFCLLFAFDGLHFVQGRISTIDTYPLFFSTLAMYFMIKFFNTNILRDKPLSCLLPFALSGVMFGFAVSSKWTGVYAGAGLFVLFLIYVIKMTDEYRHRAAATEEGEIDAYSRRFNRRMAALIACGLAFFVIIPFATYLLCYIPYMTGEKSLSALFNAMIDNQAYMYNYHSIWVVEATHQCQSAWYTWALNWRSVFMYKADDGFGMYARIHSMGNHAINWFGIAAAIYAFCRLFNKQIVRVLNLLTLEKKASYLAKHPDADPEEVEKKFKSRTPRPLEFWEREILLFSLTGFLAAMVPWMLVERSTFIYHFYPAMPYFCAFIIYLLMNVCKKHDKKAFDIRVAGKQATLTKGGLITSVYFAVVILFFGMLYPVFTGIPVSYEYAYIFRWLGALGDHVGF